ncbi:MAG TPA: DUF1800 domain-containing protein [Bryobacteraceae bacterium]|nr:DUF1800 domain-containing protein [Bryobacteraceae bacterium]
MRKKAVAGLAAALFLTASWGASKAARKDAAKAATFSKPLSPDQRIEQALNRLTFGPRPGDAQAVKAMGLKKWIDAQLHPSGIPENLALEAKLKSLDTLQMTSDEIVMDYPPPQVAQRMVSGQLPLPEDPERQVEIRKIAERAGKAQAQGQPPARQLAPADIFTPAQIRALRQGTAEQRMEVFNGLPSEKQDQVIESMPAVRQVLYDAAPPALRRRIDVAGGPAQIPVRDLMEAKMLRAVMSNRQLEEVLTDFWFNHFNIYLDKGADRFLITEYEREAIRPHVLGKFRDLLEATAKSPAMLFYLDNWESVGPAPGPLRAKSNQPRRGLNENYGRELLELHTLGVDGGYTQKDVTEVARCFTGWTILQPQLGGSFIFNARAHDNGEKTVLGVKISAGGGQTDGEKALDIVARHPATAHHISWELAQRFVADDPPPSLVNRMARTFLKTDGDLRAVMQTMLNSKEFWSTDAYRTKVKSPLELVASAVRAEDGQVDYALGLVNQVAQLGEPLYRKQEPTGYSNAGKDWLNTAGLVGRMNFGTQLADNRIAGVKAGSALPGTALGAPDFQKH